MVYGIVNTIVYVVLAQLFCSTFVDREERTDAYAISISALWIIAGTVAAMSLEEMVVIRIATAIALNIVFLMFLSKKDNPMKIIAVSVLYYVMAFSCEIAVVAAYKYFDSSLKIEKVMDNHASIYLGALCQLLEALIVFWIRRIFRKSKKDTIKSRMWLIYTIFPLYSLTLIVVFAYSFDRPLSTFWMNVFTYVACSLLLINLLIYWFISQESRRTLQAQKTELETSHTQGLAQLYEQITKERDILGKREHEYKNTIVALRGLMADKQYDKVQEILDVSNTELVQNTNVFETGHQLINSILNTKYVEAKDKGISFRFIIDDLSKLMMSDRDCIVILSNILNNAIEALEKCPQEKKEMSVKAVIEDGQFVFACRNFYVHDETVDLKSKKKDVVSHGYGIENIREAVNRNRGKCLFRKDENEFYAVVIIPLQTTKIA